MRKITIIKNELSGAALAVFLVLAAASTIMMTTTTAAFAQTAEQQQPQQQKQQPKLQLEKVDRVHFHTDGTGKIEFAYPNGTAYYYDPLEFRHNLSVENGYGYTQLPKDCLEMFFPAVLIGKVYYPNGTRLDPNTMNLSNFITGIIHIPTEFTMPDEIKITNDTQVSWSATGKILRPQEDAYYNDYCGLDEGGRNSQEEIDVLNRLN